MGLCPGGAGPSAPCHRLPPGAAADHQRVLGCPWTWAIGLPVTGHIAQGQGQDRAQRRLPLRRCPWRGAHQELGRGGRPLQRRRIRGKQGVNVQVGQFLQVSPQQGWGRGWGNDAERGRARNLRGRGICFHGCDHGGIWNMWGKCPHGLNRESRQQLGGNELHQIRANGVTNCRG